MPVKLRIDTPIEIDYYRHGGILPFVLRELMTRANSMGASRLGDPYLIIFSSDGSGSAPSEVALA